MLRRFLLWLRGVPDQKGLVLLLIFVNIGGALYGFEWYRIQLSQTPLIYWPVVPDSPLSTLLFGIMIVFLYFGKRVFALEALAYASMMKYGVWTPVIFVQAWATRGFAYWEELFLSLSHFAMALEALLFYRVFAPARAYILGAGAWLLFNDYMDYGRGFHPFLPFDQHIPSIRIYTPLLTIAVISTLLLLRRRSDQGTAWFRGVAGGSDSR